MHDTFTATDVSCQVPTSQQPHELFRDLSFELDAGQIVDLIGPSGAGKSSLLTAFARLNPYAQARMTLQGRDQSEFTIQQWRREVAYLPQKPILPGDTVADAIRLPWTLAIRSGESVESPAATGTSVIPSPGRPSVIRRRWFRSSAGQARRLLPDERIRATLDAMGCEDIDLDRPPHDLSGGQAARVSLARTLLTGPTVLLADEVDAGLDDENANKVADIMAAAAKHGMSIVRIRHRPPDGRAARTVRLEHGRLSEAPQAFDARDAAGAQDAIGEVAGVATDAMAGMAEAIHHSTQEGDLA